MKTYNNQKQSKPTPIVAALHNSILNINPRYKIYFLLFVCFTLLILQTNAQTPIVNVSMKHTAATTSNNNTASAAVENEIILLGHEPATKMIICFSVP